jgi:aspartate racemase
MRTIGLVGGLSWYSTSGYYRVVNEEVQRRLGGDSSALVALQSLDFATIRDCHRREDWEGAGRILADAARRCESAGADFVLICSNLMHKVYDDVQAAVDVPVVHIADSVAHEARAHGWQRLGLLATRWVMEEPFYSSRLATGGIGVCVPEESDRAMVDRVIFEELTHGRVEDGSRRAYVDVIERLARDGADAVVLACTEIEMLVTERDTTVPLLDSMRAHALHAVDLALEDQGAHTGRMVAR